MDKIEEVLTRGVEQVLPSKKALAELMRKRPITLYQGFDPTGDRLHIGHAVGLRKLAQFQKLGHKVIFLIGDFTGMVGDPTGKLSERKKLTHEEVLKNAKNYKEQASKILNFTGENPVEIKFNGEWLGKMSAVDFFRLAHHLTYAQIIERDIFQKRIKGGQDVYMNEFLYPFMQGYDSVAMNVDLEIGGTDQVFNMLMGRKLMKNILHKEKYVLTVPLLTDGHGDKIGKTENNIIALTDKPSDFYSKIMSLSDDSIINCFRLLTDKPLKKIAEIEKAIKKGGNPMKYKKLLAFELTEWLNSEEEAETAQKVFETTFQKRQLPERMKEVKVKESSFPLLDLVFASKLVSSRSEAKRLITQGAVDVNGETIKSTTREVVLPATIKIGKTKFVKILQI